jgi:hypothetical protein
MSLFAERAVTPCKATVNDRANVSVNSVRWLQIFTFPDARFEVFTAMKT